MAFTTAYTERLVGTGSSGNFIVIVDKIAVTGVHGWFVSTASTSKFSVTTIAAVSGRAYGEVSFLPGLTTLDAMF